MTLMLSASGNRFPLPRSATAAPWDSSLTPCDVPSPYGTGGMIHPSVVDMGQRWHGYRWWMANTPFPNGADDYENPCILGSNDRRNWTAPAGLTNPLVPNPATPEVPWFHSDTELVYNPETERLIVFYRIATNSTTPPTIYLLAQSSPDGVTWTDHGQILELPGDGARLSPAVWRVGVNDWRMWVFGNNVAARMYSATDPLGIWTDQGACNREGAAFSGWHGDVIWHEDRWLCAVTGWVTSSLDGINWSSAAHVFGSEITGWNTELPYRPTILPSTEDGFIDMWYGAKGEGTVLGGFATDYVRLPLSLWPDPPAA